MDHIRILRLYVFSGPREMVERQVSLSIQGTKTIEQTLDPRLAPENIGRMTIQAFTIDSFPEVIQAPEAKSPRSDSEQSEFFYRGFSLLEAADKRVLYVRQAGSIDKKGTAPDMESAKDAIDHFLDSIASQQKPLPPKG